MLDSNLLLEYAANFYGYGDLSAPIWFIGMEEGGGGKDTVEKRLEAWERRGRRAVEDLADYHEAMGVGHLTTGKNVKLQSTWAKLIYFQMSAEGAKPDREAVRDFQASTWGRDSSKTCLLELMPLPKRKASCWQYDEWTDIPELWSRELYFAHFAATRAQGLKTLIQENKPKIIVFYGKSGGFSCHWPWIAGVKLEHWQKAGTWRELTSGDQKFIIAPHPTAHHSTNETWARAGAEVSGDVTIDRPGRFSR
ncbi:hypothetical protein [Roseovarius atlanticus]|uniref:hypothetical protein n=1 Tax=Roseovarius atlanticus TaxID=1641875 RepID=UPI001C9869BA|nr:hypothetical protein [Roseovarius atlanticus]MBY5988543.1 hypothetical protein [Roseovarius atlanticus]MBY6123934.1 hypothetical protein [Roseovarius atlanticus]MBY6148429.1 hypothetical protein [Roseovarius atlanticus]